MSEARAQELSQVAVYSMEKWWPSKVSGGTASQVDIQDLCAMFRPVPAGLAGMHGKGKWPRVDWIRIVH